ncbi:serine acetyltransferase [Flavobacterium sp. W21_SRS_FM6]|uniref:serine acetyltransferase n=1 Tax=Flavobacterium sp. W21_SRS_FM6 TaxID=3240268 RepID=UPI003F8E0F69
MITNHNEYREYLESDKSKGYFSTSFSSYLFSDTWRFLRLLRRLEYLKNTKSGVFWKFYTLFTKYRFNKLSKKLGYTIPPNTCGPGLCLPHYGNIVINPGVKIGKNCKIHIGVNIGAAFNNSKATPVIGDDCYIAPGAKIFGAVIIANGVKIGANAVVNKSCDTENSTLLGVPAKIYPSV